MRLLPEGRLPQALRELDRAQVQGYLFARPEPADRCGTSLPGSVAALTAHIPAQGRVPAAERIEAPAAG